MTALGMHMASELASQPDTWARAAALDVRAELPAVGERVAMIGCGTSWFMAQSYAVLRERAGLGETDAFAASDAFLGRGYDRIVALTRSGTTTEVLEAVESVRGRTPLLGITGTADSPLAELVDETIEIPWADEESVVQTRFATTAFTLLRNSVDPEGVARSLLDVHTALSLELPQSALDAEQVTFLGNGWTTGLAHEAALKNREASQSWMESYPAMDYRHGPIAIAAPGRVSWMIGDEPEGLGVQVRASGADFVTLDLDPLASLVVAQRVALERARARGLDPDAPRGLTRSVILDA